MPASVFSSGRGDQRLDLFEGEEHRQLLRRARGVEVLGRIARRELLGDQEAVELPDRREVPRLAALREPALAERDQVLEHVLARDVGRVRDPALLQIREVGGEVRRVGVDGLPREPPLGTDEGDERVEQELHRVER